jgi:CheY-like chemotaxis protein
MRYRIALCGFSAFEYRAMHFSFQHPPDGETGYDVVDALLDADFAVVDADSSPAVKGVLLTGRVAQAVFVGAVAPPGATAHLMRPIDPTRILRALAEISERHAAPPPSAPLAITLVELALDESETPDSAETPAAVPAVTELLADPFAPGQVTAEADARRAAKAAARAAARRARLSHTHTDPGQLEQMRDVLVLDADESASTQLSDLLELFGFRVHAVRSMTHAADVLARRPLVAAFLDIALDGDGVALLQTIRDLPQLVGHPSPAVLIVSAQLDPADRVRAALAGVNLPLIKPVSRGDVARALESCSVVLPADARRV